MKTILTSDSPSEQGESSILQRSALPPSASGRRPSSHREASQSIVRYDEPLASYTSLKVGGPADKLVLADSIEALVHAMRNARQASEPLTLLGGGSNVLVSDAGIRGMVVVVRCRRHRIEGERVWSEAGMPLAGLARITMKAGLTGLEWAVSVPGTVGGATVGNAGAHDGCMADSVRSVRLLDVDGRIVDWPAAKVQYGYRSSVLKGLADSPLVLETELQLAYGERVAIEAKAAGFLAHRRRTQPTEASAGSIFRNPPGDYAGRVIEQAGLKGTRIGNAQVSPLHANFIVNLGGARADDVARLMRSVAETVFRETGIELQPEILFLGEWEWKPKA